MGQNNRMEEARARLLEGSLKEAEALVSGLPHDDTVEADALHLRGVIAAQRGELGRALDLLEAAIHVRAHDETMLRNRSTLALAAMLAGFEAHIRGDLRDALKHFRAGLAAGAVDRRLHSAYLYTLLHDPEQNAQTLGSEHERWTRMHCDKLESTPGFTNTRDPDRRLRIGYLCGDLRRSPLAAFLPPVISAHNRGSVDVTGYDLSGEPDGCAIRFRSACDESRPIAGLRPRAVADLIRRDQIDILLDAAGHLFSDTLLVYSYRPAPVTAAFPHYPFSNCIPGLDYVVTDARVSPHGSEHEYSETLIRLPGSFITYEPLANPDVGELPATRNGFVTFGVFQRPLKYNPATWDAWAAVLYGNPTSKLLIHFGVDELNDRESKLRRGLLRELESRGVEAERVLFEGRLDLAAHLERVGDVDIALDTFPYNGHTTTCDCLWMGVPVVTVQGAAHFSRVGASLMNSVGLSHLVANDVDGYVEAATQLASDVGTLRSIRATLRCRMQSTALGDPNKHARQLEQAYRSIWREWCFKTT